MHTTHIPCVAAIATAVFERSGLKNGYRHSGFARHQRSTSRGITSANDCDIRFDNWFNHAKPSYLISANLASVWVANS
jgi:hypothetical protein